MNEEWAQDEVITFVEVHLDWRDRVKALLGRTVHVDVHVSVEHAPGRTAGSSSVWVERFWFPWHRRGGYAEIASPRAHMEGVS
jgi:glyoxylase-like metal-dependent hydrolase (beta-lactamase superfamily II)